MNNNKQNNIVTSNASINPNINTSNVQVPIQNVQHSNLTNNQNIQVNNQVSQANQVNQTNQTKPIKKEKHKSGIKTFFLVLIFIGLIATGISIYLLVDDNDKYNTYTIVAADLVSSEKIYKSGLPYYKGTYKYIVNKKEYFYIPSKLYENGADTLIQLKYNSDDPSDVYNEYISKYFIISLIISVAFTFIFLITRLSLSGSKLEEIVNVEVVEQVTCIGGRRIYLNNINMANDSENSINSKYYVFFTNDLDRFKVGNILSFNIYKYGEVFTTEKYNNVFARAIYNFKNEDFKVIKEVPKPQVSRY